jgi:LDH2 family malate/lactate/ureidoglycolate dehydrogenase
MAARAISSTTTIIRGKSLEAFMRNTLLAAGADGFTASTVAECLAWTSLRGIDSHGARLFDRYMEGVRDGGVKAAPDIRVHQSLPAFATIDADDGFAQPAGAIAVDLGCEMAAEHGVAAVSVQNSNHPGAIGWYTMRAATAGSERHGCPFICVATTNVGPKCQDHGARGGSSFGTNPVSVSAPREEADPFCLDMSTSRRSWNLVEHARATGMPLPADVAVDAEGEPTVDADAARFLLPTGEYKGFGLGAAVEILSCATSGMAHTSATRVMYGPTSDTSVPRRLGQMYIVMRADAAEGVDDAGFRSSVQGITKSVREMPARDPQKPVMIAGDPELRISRERGRDGVPMDAAVEKGLRRWGDIHGVRLDDYIEGGD